MDTRIRLIDGQELCPPCFDAAVAGEEPVAPPTLGRTRASVG